MADGPGIPRLEAVLKDFAKAGYTTFRVTLYYQFYQRIIDTCNHDGIVWSDTLYASTEFELNMIDKQTKNRVIYEPKDLVPRPFGPALP